MALPVGEIPITFPIPGGSGSSTVTAALNKAGTNQWWDFGDSSWKTTGWTNNDLTLTSVSGVSLTDGGSPGAYAYGKATGLTSGDFIAVHIYHATLTQPYFYGIFEVT